MTTPRAMQRINANYPWDVWTNGDGHCVIQGVDFFVSIEALRNACYRHARQHGMHCTTSRVEDDGVYMRFWPADD